MPYLLHEKHREEHREVSPVQIKMLERAEALSGLHVHAYALEGPVGVVAVPLTGLGDLQGWDGRVGVGMEVGGRGGWDEGRRGKDKKTEEWVGLRGTEP
jgi:hypothetical protein